MNNIDNLIANAAARANTSTAQQETVVVEEVQMQQAAGQDFIPAQQQTQQQTQHHAQQSTVVAGTVHTLQQSQAQGQTQAYQQTQQVQANQQVVQHTQQVPANVPAHLAAYAQPTTMSMDEMAAQGIQADDWLKFTYFGMSLGSNDRQFLDHIIVDIDMTEGVGFVPCEMVKYGSSPTTYVYTYDRVVGSDGRPWLDAVQAAYNDTKPNAKKPNTPYNAVQLPMTVAEDVVDKEGKVLLPAGSVVGYTTAKTAWYNWSKFYKIVKTNNLLGQTVRVKVTNESTEYQENKWGVPKFELLGLAE